MSFIAVCSGIQASKLAHEHEHMHEAQNNASSPQFGSSPQGEAQLRRSPQQSAARKPSLELKNPFSYFQPSKSRPSGGGSGSGSASSLFGGFFKLPGRQ